MGDVSDEFIQAVSEHTGVPAFMLSGQSMADVWDSAQRAVDWKTSTAPQPPTAAVSASSPPSQPPSPQSLVNGQGWLSAWRTGQLGPAGIPAPPPRRDGRHGNAGPR